MTFPPEPWDLRGQLHASVFRVPLQDLPLDPRRDLPPGYRPLRLGRHAIIGTAWVSYEPGGVLTYREVMATLLVRRGRRIMPSILAIWVDSEASLAGGRALWGIPKELAVFDFGRDHTGARRFAAMDEHGPIARATVRHCRALPGRWPTPFSVVQTLAGAAKISPIRSRAAICLDRATFDADPDGPLGFLAGRRPVVSLTLRDFRMSFGARFGADLVNRA